MNIFELELVSMEFRAAQSVRDTFTESGTKIDKELNIPYHKD